MGGGAKSQTDLVQTNTEGYSPGLEKARRGDKQRGELIAAETQPDKGCLPGAHQAGSCAYAVDKKGTLKDVCKDTGPWILQGGITGRFRALGTSWVLDISLQPVVAPVTCQP